MARLGRGTEQVRSRHRRHLALTCLAASLLTGCSEGERIGPNDVQWFTYDPGAEGYVRSVELTLDIEAPRTADVRVDLGKRSGHSVRVVRSTKGQGRNIRVVLTDGADEQSYYAAATVGEDTFGGARMRPYRPLGFLHGERAGGEWQLTIYNNGNDGDVVLRDWSVQVDTTPTEPDPQLSVATIYDHWQSAPAGIGQEFCVSFKLPRGYSDDEISGEMVGASVVDSNFVVLPGSEFNPIRYGCIFYRTTPNTRTPGLLFRVSAGSLISEQAYGPRFVEPPTEGMSMVAHFRSDELGYPIYVPSAVETWTDEVSGRSFAISWNRMGASFVELGPVPRLVATLSAIPGAGSAEPSGPALAVYDHAAYLVHAGGMQVVDLTRLLEIPSGETRSLLEDRLVEDFESAHALVVDEDEGRLYAIGACSYGDSTKCRDLVEFDLSEPVAPRLLARTPPKYWTDVFGGVCGRFRHARSDWSGRQCVLAGRRPYSDDGMVVVHDLDDDWTTRSATPVFINGITQPHRIERVNGDLAVTGASANPRAMTLRLEVGSDGYWSQAGDSWTVRGAWFGSLVFAFERRLFVSLFAGGVVAYDWNSFKTFRELDLQRIGYFDSYTDDNLDGTGANAVAGSFDVGYADNRWLVLVGTRGLFVLTLASDE